MEELKGVEVTATDAGNVRYASEGTDHHGDLAFALGLAVTADAPTSVAEGIPVAESGGPDFP